MKLILNNILILTIWSSFYQICNADDFPNEAVEARVKRSDVPTATAPTVSPPSVEASHILSTTPLGPSSTNNPTVENVIMTQATMQPFSTVQPTTASSLAPALATHSTILPGGAQLASTTSLDSQKIQKPIGALTLSQLKPPVQSISANSASPSTVSHQHSASVDPTPAPGPAPSPAPTPVIPSTSTPTPSQTPPKTEHATQEPLASFSGLWSTLTPSTPSVNEPITQEPPNNGSLTPSKPRVTEPVTQEPHNHNTLTPSTSRVTEPISQEPHNHNTLATPTPNLLNFNVSKIDEKLEAIKNEVINISSEVESTKFVNISERLENFVSYLVCDSACLANLTNAMDHENVIECAENNSASHSVPNQPLNCNFDANTFCNWANGQNGVEDDFDWQIETSVSTSNTASKNGKFAMAQGHPKVTDTAKAWLRSPTIDGLSTPKTLSFNYLKTATPHLEICIKDTAGSTQLHCLETISKSVDQKWEKGEVVIPPNPLAFEIIFVATNFHAASDSIDLDDIQFGTSVEKTIQQHGPCPQNKTLSLTLECAPACLADFFKAINLSMNKDIFDAISVVEAFSEPENAKHICKLYQEADHCMKSCPPSFFQNLIKKGLTIPDFVCIKNSEAYEKLGYCIYNVSNELEDQCNKTCESNSLRLDEYANAIENSWDGMGKSEQINEFMNATCATVDCYTNCVRPTITSKCGENATKLIDEFDITAISWILDLIKPMNADHNFPPQSCKKYDGKMGKDND